MCTTGKITSSPHYIVHFYCTTMIFPFITLFILLLATSNDFVSAISSNDTDHQALLSFKASITGDPFGVLGSWNNSIHFCQWNGVTCSPRHQRVTALELYSHNLVGTLSSHIGNLSFLRVLYLYKNNFHGSIPDEIGLLFHLQYLYLDNNLFRGEFPFNLSQCVDIRNISMFDNNLEGELPAEFTSWSKLYHFDLQNNHFTGLIPRSIGNISFLHFLDLGGNNLRGVIPLEVTHLKELEYLSLSTNKLSGMVTDLLHNLSSVIFIYLTENDLEGTLPANFDLSLPKLHEFAIGANRISGPFPPSIVNASDLVTFDVIQNNITGPIPINLGILSSLEWLALGNNPLGDNQRHSDLSFFSSLVNCTHLKILKLAYAGLRGELPNFIVNLSTTISYLDLSGNHIYGCIPREIGKLVNLTAFGLYDNLFTGTIPESVGELSKLGKLDLGHNNISGVIPTSISNITHLLGLSLESNMLQGSLPTGLFNISTLQILSLAINSLEGEIPEQIDGISSQCFKLYLHQNLFTGPIPSTIGSLKQLVFLSLSENKLIGNIPTTLGGCVMLEELYISGNLFQGRIPSAFKTLKSLRILDLSRNNISDDIPRFFDGFPQLEFLNLSHNKLEGEVSKEGIFSNISAFSVVGNSRLCGGIQALHLPSCPNKKNTFSMTIVLILVLVSLGILSACFALICYRRHRNSKTLIDLVPVMKDNQYLKLSYQDLLRATNEFSPNNLVGEGRYGSVYKGVTELVEHIVAVKVLKLEVHGANKSLLAECETLRNIRHRNLIKFITACFSTDFKGNDFKALVFEFMTNGSVENWLHPSPYNPRKERNLTLLQRLDISIDVALGLDYLHHQSHASIIHCDIKPSNILLDDDLVAHIGDFGLSRVCFADTSDINHPQTSSTGVRGTVGYVPPEYGMWGGISTEADVYSYGIFLLEMFSGKRPTESSILIDGSSNIHDYVRKALPQRVMDIADPRIVLDQEEHDLTVNQSTRTAILEVCLASIFEVGILCSEETPRKRIDISVATKKLHVARDKFLQCRQ